MDSQSTLNDREKEFLHVARLLSARNVLLIEASMYSMLSDQKRVAARALEEATRKQ